MKAFNFKKAADVADVAEADDLLGLGAHGRVDMVTTMTSRLTDYLLATQQAAHHELYPMPSADTAAQLSVDATSSALRQCIAENESLRALEPLVRLVFSLPATSSQAERAFSASGRVCAPMRSRRTPTTIENLTILQQYLLHRDLKKFCTAFVDFISNKN